MSTSTTEWLKNHFLAKNNLAAALEMAHYQVACSYLVKIRSLYEKLGQEPNRLKATGLCERALLD